jgi:hypothetical protein
MISEKKKQEYFSPDIWTWVIMLKRFAKRVFGRSVFRSRETGERCNVLQAARLSGKSLGRSWR